MNLSALRMPLLIGGAGVVIYIVALLLLEGCYKCADAQCSNLPPVSPDYPAGTDIVIAYPDDSPEAAASPCARACANLLRLGCPEGGVTKSGASCYRGCTHMVQLRRVPIACWSGADSIDHLRACGPELRCVP